MQYSIPFNKPFISGKELYYMAGAVLGGHSAGDGSFTKKCHAFIEHNLNARKVLLTHSYTAALEMCALLTGAGPEHEVILPSFAFVSLANAFYMNGVSPVFVDIRPDTLNIDEAKVEDAVTDLTKAILVTHYCGVAAEMNPLLSLAEKYGLYIVEDAAHGFNTTYGDKYLGTFGDVGVFSFHETSNLICGEGGAIVVNKEALMERAEIIREKGTNRSKFFRGEVDKYTWVDIGSSYLPSDLLAAFLYGQLENMENIHNQRDKIFGFFYESLKPLCERGLLKLPYTVTEKHSKSHFFYIVLNDEKTRADLIGHLKAKGILAVIHYTPLHLSPIGRSLGYKEGDLPVTEAMSERLLRLPFYHDMTIVEQSEVVERISDFFDNSH